MASSVPSGAVLSDPAPGDAPSADAKNYIITGVVAPSVWKEVFGVPPKLLVDAFKLKKDVVLTPSVCVKGMSKVLPSLTWAHALCNGASFDPEETEGTTTFGTLTLGVPPDDKLVCCPGTRVAVFCDGITHADVGRVPFTMEGQEGLLKLIRGVGTVLFHTPTGVCVALTHTTSRFPESEQGRFVAYVYANRGMVFPVDGSPGEGRVQEGGAVYKEASKRRFFGDAGGPPAQFCKGL